MRAAVPAAPAISYQAPPLYRFSVEQYHRMIAVGVLSAGERAEFLEGLVVEKMTRNPPHEVALVLLQLVLARRLPEEWHLRIQSAITTQDSEPEPDGAVVPGPPRRFLNAHPGPRDLALVVEVADTTLEMDRQDKGRIYARARIPIYWIVNIPDNQIEVYTAPRGGRNPAYRERRDYQPQENLPLVVAGQQIGEIPVRDLLP